jgi:hypothetical protein
MYEEKGCSCKYAKLVFSYKNMEPNLWFLIQISPSKSKGSAYALNNLHAITITVVIAPKNKKCHNLIGRTTPPKYHNVGCSGELKKLL